mgnify:FL=1
MLRFLRMRRPSSCSASVPGVAPPLRRRLTPGYHLEPLQGSTNLLRLVLLVSLVVHCFLVLKATA